MVISGMVSIHTQCRLAAHRRRFSSFGYVNNVNLLTVSQTATVAQMSAYRMERSVEGLWYSHQSSAIIGATMCITCENYDMSVQLKVARLEYKNLLTLSLGSICCTNKLY